MGEKAITKGKERLLVMKKKLRNLYSLLYVLQVQHAHKVFKLLPREVLREPVCWHLIRG